MVTISLGQGGYWRLACELVSNTAFSGIRFAWKWRACVTD